MAMIVLAALRLIEVVLRFRGWPTRRPSEMFRWSGFLGGTTQTTSPPNCPPPSTACHAMGYSDPLPTCCEQIRRGLQEQLQLPSPPALLKEMVKKRNMQLQMTFSSPFIGVYEASQRQEQAIWSPPTLVLHSRPSAFRFDSGTPHRCQNMQVLQPAVVILRKLLS